MDVQLRTFGKSKQEVVDFSMGYLGALQKGGILGCIKHFPGIGAVEFDPHEDLPSVNLCREELFDLDLVPYLSHFETGNVFAVMTGHTTFPSFDLQQTDSNGKLLPSSLSHNIVTGLLRDELKFDGLALTDDLEMGAIINNYGIGEASKMAVQAGNDFLLICNDTKSIYDGFNGVLNAVEDGDISEERIDRSIKRISRVRSRLMPPKEFSIGRLAKLSEDISELKQSV